MFVTKSCLNCEKLFDALVREVNRGNGKYCSLVCAMKHIGANRPRPEANVICAHCNKSFYKNISKQTRSKSGLFFCSRECKDVAQCIGGIRSIMPPHFGQTVKNYRTIAFRVENKPKICERCGFDKHEAAIIVHHKDRNRKNNHIDNLEVLCANCHLIEHYGELVDSERIELS